MQHRRHRRPSLEGPTSLPAAGCARTARRQAVPAGSPEAAGRPGSRGTACIPGPVRRAASPCRRPEISRQEALRLGFFPWLSLEFANSTRSITATMPNIPQLERLLDRAEAVLAQLEAALPPAIPPPDWTSAIAFRWRTRRMPSRPRPRTAALLRLLPPPDDRADHPIGLDGPLHRARRDHRVHLGPGLSWACGAQDHPSGGETTPAGGV